MERPLSFFVMVFVLLFAVIGFIFVVFDLRSVFFIFQLAVLLAFMFFLSFAMFMMYAGKRASWAIISAVLLLMIFDALVIMLFTRRFSLSYGLTLLFATVGLIIAIAVSIQRREEVVEKTHYTKSQYYYPLGEKPEAKEEVKEEVKQELKPELKEEIKREIKSESKSASVQSTFTPGKFVASKNAKAFHAPKCEWANNIKKSNQVWFNSKDDARKQGYEAHACVE